MGIGQLGTKDFVWLPEQGKLELAQLFQQIEKEVAWPWQLTVVLVTPTRKPSGDDRAIGALSNLRGRGLVAAGSTAPVGLGTGLAIGMHPLQDRLPYARP
eukprot:676429-Pyramimonas_sp.AAC.1